MRESYLRRRDVLHLGALATFGAVTGGCATATQRTANFDWTIYRPEDVGMSSSGFEGVRAAVQRQIDNHSLLGAVSIVARHNKVVWYEAQGARDPSGVPLRKDDIFRMMSASKPVTAVAILLMMEAGRLSIDDNVSRYIPSFSNPKVAVAPQGWERAAADATAPEHLVAQIQLVPAAREITIKDLLTHTAGFATGGPGALVHPVQHLEGEVLGPYVERIGATPLDFQPGSKFSYSPVGAFDVLLRIVEITSGQAADAFVRERIMEPLAMHDTFYNVPSEKAQRFLTLYERASGGWREARSVIGNGPTTYFSGAGGLMSTARDYMQFEGMLLNQGQLNGRRVLKPESVALMSRNHIGDLYENAIPGYRALTAGQGFGLGVAVTLDPQAAGTGRGRSAFGWPGAYGTDAWADPELDLTAAFFVQQPSIVATLAADAEFARAIRAAVVA